MRLLGQLTRSIESEFGHVCSLSQPHVAALPLAERRDRSRHVENVVDDLEQHAKLTSKTAELADCVTFGVGRELQHAHHAGADQPSGLELVQPPKALGPGGSGCRDIEIL